MIIAVLILAAVELSNSLDYYQPEEFFSFTNTLNIKMGAYNAPSNVVGSSCNYCPVITNLNTFGEWKFFRNGDPTNGLPQPTYDGGLWNVEECIFERGEDVNVNAYMHGGENAWQIGPWYAVSNGVELARYKAEREWTVTEFASTNYAHRGMKATRDTMATLYNTFGGFYERLYYASQGDSNVWSEVDYGPRDRRHFQIWDSSLFDYHPTNRNIVSSRFLDAGNVMSLREHIRKMIPKFCSNDGVSFVYRPGWLLDFQYDDPNVDGIVWWSSHVLGGQDTISPSPFGWTEHPINHSITNAWSQSAKCLGHCARTDPKGTDSRAPSVWKQILSRILFEGDPERDNLQHVKKPDVRPFTALIKTNFPHASANLSDVSTRRLFPDDLATINQTLWLMDTTYHIPHIGDYTNHLRKVSVTKGIAREAKTSAEIKVVDGQFVLDRTIKASDLSWHTVTNYTEVETDVIPALSDREQVRIRATTTEVPLITCTVDGPKNGVFELIANDDFIERLGLSNMAFGADKMNVMMSLSFSSDRFPPVLNVSLSGSFHVRGADEDEWNWCYDEKRMDVGFDTLSVPLTFNESCKRYYWRASKVYRTLQYGPCQPGWQAPVYKIDSDPIAAFFSGVIERRGGGMPDPEYAFVYGPYDKAFYKLSRQRFSSIGQLNNLVAGVHNDIRERINEDMIQFCGANPFDHATYMPLDVGIFADAHLKTTFSHVNVNAVFTCGDEFEIRVEFDENGDISYWSIVRLTDNFTVYDIPIATVSLGIQAEGETPDIPSAYADRPSFAADGLFKFVTRIPWKWGSIIEFKE